MNDHEPPDPRDEPDLSTVAAPEHERALLGCLLVYPERAAEVVADLDGHEFAEPRHETLWHVYQETVARGALPDLETITDALRQRGGRDAALMGYLPPLVGLGSPVNLTSYVQTIRRYWRKRTLSAALTQAQHAVTNGTDATAVLERIYGILDPLATTVLSGDTRAPTHRFAAGGSFILDTDPNAVPVWGDGTDVLWAEGEALIIAGRQGLGKTTIAQQLALGRIGAPGYDDLLGHHVTPGNRNTLYLAMDRPRQAARSFRRMVRDEWRDHLDSRLAVWPGPPPADLAKSPATLLDLARAADADTVIVDSLKDAAVGLKDDEVAAGYNRARQTAIVAGIEIVELHHDRKQTSSDSHTRRRDVDDLYGSTWLPSGAGSVLQLAGNAGDPIVTLHHVKQPAAEVGPYQVLHDHDTGRSMLFHGLDLVALVNTRPDGIGAREVASLMFDTEKPTQAEKHKAMRRLDSLARKGRVTIVQEPDAGAKIPKLWGPE